MSAVQPSTEQEAMDGLASYVSHELDAGRPQKEIVNDIVVRGVNRKTAEHLVRSLAASLKLTTQTPEGRAALAAQYRRQMRSGSVWAVGGTVVTLGSYLLAEGGGGKYVIAWGAIVYGLWTYARGYFGWTKYRDSAGVAGGGFPAKCPYCSLEVSLDEHEQSTRHFTCPRCTTPVDL